MNLRRGIDRVFSAVFAQRDSGTREGVDPASGWKRREKSVSLSVLFPRAALTWRAGVSFAS
jgi:hypothetical protein